MWLVFQQLRKAIHFLASPFIRPIKQIDSTLPYLKISDAVSASFSTFARHASFFVQNSIFSASFHWIIVMWCSFFPLFWKLHKPENSPSFLKFWVQKITLWELRKNCYVNKNNGWVEQSKQNNNNHVGTKIVLRKVLIHSWISSDCY